MAASRHVLIYIWLIFRTIKCSSTTKIFPPTVINSTGEYYISNVTIPNSGIRISFAGGTINCTSTKLCYMLCKDTYSCGNTIIKCNNAEICNIDIPDENHQGAQYLSIYTSTKNTFIYCSGGYGCYHLKIFTAYTNYPSSYTELICISHQYACESFKIYDANNQSISGYTNSQSMKIFCDGFTYDDFGHCTLEYPTSNLYPLLSPTITNSTGEYYYNVTSFLNIVCTHDIYCFIECTDYYGCRKVHIDCGNADNCIMTCPKWCDAITWDSVHAQDNQFSFICQAPGFWSCNKTKTQVYTEPDGSCCTDYNGYDTCLTSAPTSTPTSAPTLMPTSPSSNPTIDPTINPTLVPITAHPTIYPTNNPIYDPTVDPTADPSTFPSDYPSKYPSKYPSSDPSFNPSFNPTKSIAIISINTTIPNEMESTLSTFIDTDKSKSSQAGNSNQNKIVYIVVGMCLFVVILISLIGVWIYRRKRMVNDNVHGQLELMIGDDDTK